VEPRTTFLQRYASEAGGDAAFGLRAQWRRTDFECADPPCGVDQPAKIWRALGEIQVEKMVRRHYFFELLLLLGGASVAWKRTRSLRGVQRPDVHLTARDHALQRCMLAGRQAGRQAGRMDRSEVVWSGLWVGVARRSGTGGARRKYVWLGVAICQRGPDWSKIRGPSGCSAGR
jgi:hypothetical protein